MPDTISAILGCFITESNLESTNRTHKKAYKKSCKKYGISSLHEIPFDFLSFFLSNLDLIAGKFKVYNNIFFTQKYATLEMSIDKVSEK